jgi:insulysin
LRTYSEEQALPILAKIQQLVGHHLTQSESQQLTNGNHKISVKQGVTNGVNGVRSREPTYITNVPEFKARLAVSAGPSPLADLTEFEDFEPKL